MTKLEKLLEQVAAEKSRLAVAKKAKAKAAKIDAERKKQRHIASIAVMVIEAGLHDIPQDVLRAGLKRITMDFEEGAGRE